MFNKEHEKHTCQECDYYEIRDDYGWCRLSLSPTEYDELCCEWRPDKWVGTDKR